MSTNYQRNGNGSSILSSKIGQLKDTIDQQNSMISASQKREQVSRDSLKQLYTAAIKYTENWEKGPSRVVDIQYPVLRHQDILDANQGAMMEKMFSVFATVCAALSQTSNELTEAYREMDIALEDSLSTFRTLQAQESRTARGSTVLGNLAPAPQAQRPATPETALVDRSRSDSVVASPENSVKPSAGDKKPAPRPTGATTKKSSSQPIGALMDAITPSKTAKK